MISQYLQRYAEPEARLLAAQPLQQHYHHVLVVPAYRESATFADRLLRLGKDVPKLLIIVVLNQPDTEADTHCNDALRAALHSFAPLQGRGQSDLALAHCSLHSLAATSDLLLVERPQPLPGQEGVGLARKLGCDIAIGLRAAGCIKSRWLHNSDADAQLPENYFQQAEQHPQAAVAITHPFTHLSTEDSQSQAVPETGCSAHLPMALYELRLHYYVLGLRYAASPYAFHTLGSCLSVTFQAYQQVRGYPRRAAAEDFYLLNKVAKLGPVNSPGQPLVTIDTRFSDRVPFGTGPAVRELAKEPAPLDAKLFYNPDSFHALGALIALAPDLYNCAQPLHMLQQALGEHAPALPVLEQLGLAKCLQHCQQHSRNSAAFTRHFHQWFDGFRTLKLIHGLRNSGWSDLNLAQSLAHPRRIWPPGDFSAGDVQTLLGACTDELGWILDHGDAGHG